ncbi:methyl-accepting chemotaxis protein [Clostridium beijerinckii]|uniref:Methyl-accepting chemotaxis protein n=1 Tax=Clostridium beijerinckii TaxID=1520 RepID=A0AB74VEX6_CLOBE|nr:methyl-accepting chemotaxis protein [Clostridium beijerinckii]NRZ29302.1 methyl-accepting chemotaxis protein [Clostridium beijerinckii]NYB94928.1 methyl-accepting chemotaxis protein [Clostridium beijerinckii]OOM25712.1 methyl-accepting chemotaxis protein McpB [Clostridium beijerinckii]QUN34941.1 methyl-accepting chemotaxis protein [Clostridium beijerinckii]SQB00076.1 methyl-accepting chemotaxis sensory transducer [Clostridium beijerinckii]
MGLIRKQYEKTMDKQTNNKDKNSSGKIKSIKSELLITMLSISVVLTLGIILCVSTILSKYYDNEINSKNEMLSKLISKNVSSFMDTAYKVTEDLAYNSEVREGSKDTKEKVLKETKDRNPYFELLYMQDEKGMQTGRSSGDLADRSDRWWFSQAKSSLSSFVSKSYYSASSKNPVTSIFVPLVEDNKFVGVMGSDINLEKLQEVVSEYSDEASGRYSFIIDGEGVVVAHPNTEVIEELYNYKNQTRTTGVKEGNPKEEPIEVSDGLKEIIAQLMAGNDGSIKYKENGQNYYASYTNIKLDGNSLNWSVITVQKESSAKAIINNITEISLIAGLIILLAAAAVIMYVSKRISMPIIEISNLLSIASTGDFTVKSSTRAKNEIKLLGESFNEMMSKVSALLIETKDLTHDMKESSAILAEKSQETTNVARDINITSQEIAQGASNQASGAEESARLGEDMRGEFNQLEEKTNLMINESINSSKAIANGINKVQDLKEKAQTTISIVEKTQGNIGSLSDKSKNIENILGVLKGIAEQTQLLALNASIEAARAGEAGKGFAVVATEIQKLSQNSAVSTKNIAEIILNIKQDILSSVSDMKKVKEVSMDQFVSVNEVNEAFNSITQATDTITTAIDYMGSFVEEMNDKNEQVVNSINNIAAISEETAACSQEVTASIQTQTEAILEVSQEVEKLKEKAERLEMEVDKFKI